MAPLAAGALSALASTGVSKIFGNGLIIPVPYPHPSKQQELLNKAGPYLTNAQINQMLKSNKLKLTKKKKSQDGGILHLLYGSTTKAVKRKRNLAINQYLTLIF